MLFGEKMSTTGGVAAWIRALRGFGGVWREKASWRAKERSAPREMVDPVTESMKAGAEAGKPPTRSGVRGQVPRRWVNMDLRGRATEGSEDFYMYHPELM